jgi:hypothetical protein
MSDNDSELAKYYTIKFENFLEMMKKVNSLYYILSDLLQDYVAGSFPDQFDSTPIPELTGYFAATTELRDFLEDIINNPSEEEIEIIKKHNIKDVLVSIEDLNAINIMFDAIEEYNFRLYSNHNISTIMQ